MNLNSRSMAMLKKLLTSSEYIKITDLADFYRVSDRAIRYDLNKIEGFLVKNGFNYLDRNHMKGVRLEQNKKLSDFIEEFSGNYTPYKYNYSKEEMSIFITLYILQSTKPVSIVYFEHKLYSSRTTIINLLSNIEDSLIKSSLKLIRKPKVGLYIEGEEVHKRKEIKDMLLGTISIEDIYSYIDKHLTLSKLNNLIFEDILQGIDIKFIDSLIVYAEKELGRSFDDSFYMNLLVQIIMILKRNNNIDSFISDGMQIKLDYTKEFKIANTIKDKLENRFNIVIPKYEVIYISMKLLGATALKDDYLYIEDFNQIYDIAKSMTKYIEDVYNIDFGVKEEKIIQGLLLHIKPAIYRIKFDLSLENPMFEEVIKNYNEIFIDTKEACSILEEYIKKPINDHEISYITLHFAAAIENTKNKRQDRKKVIIVCGTGIATAKIVATQIKKAFNVEIVNIVSSRAIGDIGNYDYDIIISTVDIPKVNVNSYIRVNSILSEEDYKNLKKHINIRFNKYKEYEINLIKVKKLITLVQAQCEVKDLYKLQYEFMKVISDTNEELILKDNISMYDLLKEGYVSLSLEANDWKSVIKKGTEILEEKKSVKDNYYLSIVNNIEKYGPYMVVAPGVLLAHASPEDGALRLGLSLITLKKGVDFNDDFKVPVKLIITLAAVDNHSHLDVLAQVIKLVTNKKDVEEIINTSNEKDVLEIIKRYSQN